MLYRIAIFAALAYILVFVFASLIHITGFSLVKLSSPVFPMRTAWAGTLTRTSSPRATRKVTRIAASSVKSKKRSHRGWDRNINAHPAKGLYKRSFRVTATAYTPINTRREGGRYTFTERDGRAIHGIAVDPDLIPIGSHLWIPGYGHAVADDTGGRIRGHHVDVRIQDYDRMREWGRRKVRIYVLSDNSAPHARKAAARYTRRA